LYNHQQNGNLVVLFSRFSPPWDSTRPVLALGLLSLLGLAKSLYEHRDTYSWQTIEQIATQVDQVTPAGAPLWADEFIYFLTRRPPPAGMEFRYSHKLELPAAEAASLHILPDSQLKREVAAEVFSTIATCEDTDHGCTPARSRSTIAIAPSSGTEYPRLSESWSIRNPQRADK
jgi:hypothetical protein